MNNKNASGDVTRLLLQWRAGDEAALAALFPIVYDELRALAQRHLRRERGEHTLQRTALVHEAFLRLADQNQVDWQSRAQFFGIASQMMRRILVDHARKSAAAKRGGGARPLDIDAVLGAGDDADGDTGVPREPPHEAGVDFEAIHAALERLEALDARQGKLVELRFFGGLSIQEAAGVIGVSPATAKREWAVARAWLQRELTAEDRA